MNKIVLVAAAIICCAELAAQNPLVGTWQRISIKGRDDEGNRFAFDNTNSRELKIITPTHYILMSHLKKGDSLIFESCEAGIAKVDGNKYVEIPYATSLDSAHNNFTTDFTWKVMGDKFVQSGTVTFADGKKLYLESVVYQRVRGTPASIKHNPLVGTWDQLSSSFTAPDGFQGSHTNATHTRFYIFTPTHWMMIGHAGKKFQTAMGGTYQLKGNKVIPDFSYTSAPEAEKFSYDVSQRLEGDKLFIKGIRVGADGRKLQWEDVYQRVKN